MTEYIERNAAIAYAPLPKHLREYQTMNLDDAWEDGYDFAIRQIEAIPTADVMEVVRCWECKHYNKPRLGFCEAHLVRVHGDDFCSYGKKREER